MQLRKSKKIIIYFFILFLVGSISNNNLKDLKFRNIGNINIKGLDIKEKAILLKNIKDLNLDNIFFINRDHLINELELNSLVEKYFIFKKYPSSIDINIEKTKFLAKINKNGKIFYIGSNGKLTKSKFSNSQLPFIFGNPDINEFFSIKKIIDKSKISYTEIKNLYFFPSKRWDLELKNNIVIKLPYKGTNLALKSAVEFLYKNEFKENKIIDTRIKNQIILND